MSSIDEADAALEAGGHLADVVLEALQRRDPPFGHLAAATEEANAPPRTMRPSVTYEPATLPARPALMTIRTSA